MVMMSRQLIGWVGRHILPHERPLRAWLRGAFPTIDVDDVVQESYCRIATLTRVEHIDDPRRYLFRTATNLAFDHFRETKRERGRELVVIDEGAHESADLRHDMMRTFAELKPRERALLWLAHVEESDHVEIAEALGVKTKSVKVLLFRARRRLADLLRKKGLGS